MALEDAQGNYINGFRPGTTTPAQAQADGAFKAASEAAQALKKGKTPATGPIEPNPPMHLSPCQAGNSGRPAKVACVGRSSGFPRKQDAFRFGTRDQGGSHARCWPPHARCSPFRARVETGGKGTSLA